jgi:IS66 C-terminal element
MRAVQHAGCAAGIAHDGDKAAQQPVKVVGPRAIAELGLLHLLNACSKRQAGATGSRVVLAARSSSANNSQKKNRRKNDTRSPRASAADHRQDTPVDGEKCSSHPTANLAGQANVLPAAPVAALDPLSGGWTVPDRQQRCGKCDPTVCGGPEELAVLGQPSRRHRQPELVQPDRNRKANGIEPYVYLRRVFTDLPNAQRVEQIEILSPRNVKSRVG